jgi:hypothetical protein
MKKLQTLTRAGLALALISPAIFAQQGEDVESTAYEVSQRFAEWNQANGALWHVYTDVETGYVEFLFGGNSEGAFEPVSDEDYLLLASIAIESTEGMHGIEAATLVEERALHLPLGLIGSTDKFTTRFGQEINGVPVLGGFVNVLFTTEGRMLSLQTSAMPDIAGMSTDAAVGSDQAANQALRVFEAETGLPGTVVGTPIKAIGQLRGEKSRDAVLVWQVEVEWHGRDMEPEGYSYWIDARNGGVLQSKTTIHNVDVGGTISTMATPGVRPDQANNPPVSFPLNHARVTAGGAGSVITDENGNFNFPGVSGSLNLTIEYFGDWADVDNDVGGEYTFNTSASGTGNSILLNNPPSALITSQSSTFQIISAQRDWIRSINPSDNTGDFRALANVNLASTCNAFFNGSSVNMYQAGGGCNATSYSTVVSHEMGHWYNVLYGTGNGSDGMGEGNADVFSLYMYNTNQLGMDFLGQGSGPLRNGNNTLQFCGDNNTGCHGGAVHTEGQVWMGACWKIYLQLEASLGAASADLISDSLFLGWMNSYNQTTIRSVIESQWLTLDDNNGNINDGTPHYTELDAGFQQQGFPGFDLPLIDIVNVTELPEQNSEVGPYVVDATVTSLIGQTISSVDLRYNVNGGSFQTVSMVNSSGDTWSGGIPGQVSPAVVRYYVEATDSLSNTDTSPDGAPGNQGLDTYRFVIGSEVIFFSEDFESGEGGWTHNTFGDTSNSQDDWQFGTPGGQSGDPSSAASGNNAWGNDLAIGNFNGAYQDDVHNYLRSPNINLSSATGSILRYNRWLTVEEGVFDQARIKVNGNLVWTNPSSGNLTDTGWVSHEVDISAFADGNSSVQIEFSLQTDGGLTFGGWTLDDVQIVVLEPVPSSCETPTNYGFGKLTSVFSFPILTGVNPPSESANNFQLNLIGAVPNTFGLMFSGATSADVPFLGGSRLVGLPIQREGSYVTDAFGEVTVAQPIAAGSSGTTRYYQAWFRDGAQADGTSAGLSDGLEVRFCD